MGTLIRVNVNPKGGVPKHRVEQASITRNGVSGDKQKHLRFHGGPTRAVSLYAVECISALQAEGHPIAAGTTGENLTIEGIDWSTLRVGSRLCVGNEVVLEVTSYAAPCKQIAGSFLEGNFARMSEKLHPGWSRLYTRVLAEGTVQEGDSVTCDIDA